MGRFVVFRACPCVYMKAKVIHGKHWCRQKNSKEIVAYLVGTPTRPALSLNLRGHSRLASSRILAARLLMTRESSPCCACSASI